MKDNKLATGLVLVILGTLPAASLAATPHNLVLFVPDGLRSQIVSEATAPAMAQLRAQGVDFHNSHAMFPTFTTSNASAFHGSFSRADTWNFMAARGPDFRAGFIDPLPASNADIGMTIAHILGLSINPTGKLTGRVLTEALITGSGAEQLPPVTADISRSDPEPRYQLKTVLKTQTVDGQVYLDAAGFPDRTVGLAEAR
jgi:hypothetical protein